MIKEDYLKFDTIISPNSYLFSSAPGFGGKHLQKFKRGQFTIDDTLDLHGYTLTSAEQALEAFMQDSLEEQLRCLLIIHGKGSQAILKNYVNHYLEDHPKVLAFCSAKQKDGGTGAVYVLLKRQKYTGDDNEEE